MAHREIRVLLIEKKKNQKKQEHVSKPACAVACRFSRALYLVPQNSHVQPRVYVHARVVCNATSLRRAGGCKRPNVPQRMHASPAFYPNYSRDSLHASRIMNFQHEAVYSSIALMESVPTCSSTKSYTRICCCKGTIAQVAHNCYAHGT